MSIGDLVFCHGFQGLIIKSYFSTHYTEHYVYWFGLRDIDRFSWVRECQLLRIQ